MNNLKWRVHLPNLIDEIYRNEECLRTPLQITKGLLAQLGEIAARINDDELNAIMCRLTIYALADPESVYYDPMLYDDIIEKAEKKP